VRVPDEDELDRTMARLADGEREAFDPLFRALHPRALRFARARLGPDLAQDAAQAALVKVFSRASEFTPGAAVLPWFYAVVANEMRAVARTHVPREAGFEDGAESPWVASSEDPERLLLERELHEAMERAIADLDEPSAEAIGVLLGRAARPAVGEVAFRKRISRAYARLRVLLGGFDGR
jgi:RNA polymerase sigma-70 factor (ECF subfamily)